jgi:signal transduction histidine kinase
MSLRLRFALLIAVLIAVAVIAQGAVGYVRFERLGLAEADRVLQNFLDDRARPSRRDDGGRGGRPSIRLDSDPNVRARVQKDNLIVQTFGDAFPEDFKVSEGGFSTIGAWRVLALDLPNGARFEAITNLGQQRLGAANYLRTLALTVPLFAGLGALAAWLLSAQALKPLETLIAASGRVAESGNLAERVVHGQGQGELERLGRTFNQMLERLQSFREREVSFTRTAAHELRTPLAAMQAQLDAQANGWASSEEALTTARTQVERMTKLSEALLVLAREGRTEMLIFDLGKMASELALKRSATFIGLSHLDWLGNPVLLERALENLLENASKHAPNTVIGVQLETRENQVLISVTDGGSGMTAEALARATEAFYRAAGTKAYGSGLGLAVVDSIAKAHGGVLYLENAIPHGLRAILEIEKPRV